MIKQGAELQPGDIWDGKKIIAIERISEDKLMVHYRGNELDIWGNDDQLLLDNDEQVIEGVV